MVQHKKLFNRCFIRVKKAERPFVSIYSVLPPIEETMSGAEIQDAVSSTSSAESANLGTAEQVSSNDSSAGEDRGSSGSDDEAPTAGFLHPVSSLALFLASPSLAASWRICVYCVSVLTWIG